MPKRKESDMKKFGFCKWLLIADYLILLMLMGVFAAMSFREADTANLAIVIGAWIAQLGISSGAYYWKAKAENLVKLPLYMLNELPEDMKDRVDPTRVIESVITIKE